MINFLIYSVYKNKTIANAIQNTEQWINNLRFYIVRVSFVNIIAVSIKNVNYKTP